MTDLLDSSEDPHYDTVNEVAALTFRAFESHIDVFGAHLARFSDKQSAKSPTRGALSGIANAVPAGYAVVSLLFQARHSFPSSATELPYAFAQCV